MSEERVTTARGLVIHDTWTDSHDHRVRVQQSSALGLGHCWIYVDDGEGRSVVHWRDGGGWETARRPGEGDPPYDPAGPLRVQSEGWSAMSAHLSPADCRRLIAALEAHLAMVEAEGLGPCERCGGAEWLDDEDGPCPDCGEDDDEEPTDG